MNWGPERYGPFFFSLGAPALVCLVVGLTACTHKRLPKLPARTRLVVHTILSAALGVLAAAWIHFVPCLHLICDGGYHDDPSLRTVLSWALGPVASATSATLFARQRRPLKSPEVVVAVGQIVAIDLVETVGTVV